MPDITVYFYGEHASFKQEHSIAAPSYAAFQKNLIEQQPFPLNAIAAQILSAKSPPDFTRFMDEQDLDNDRIDPQTYIALLHALPPKLQSLNLKNLGLMASSKKSKAPNYSETALSQIFENVPPQITELNLEGNALSSNPLLLQKLLQKLPHVHTLNLSNNGIEQLPKAARRELLQSFPSTITTLKMYSQDPAKAQSFFNKVSACLPGKVTLLVDKYSIQGAYLEYLHSAIRNTADPAIQEKAIKVLKTIEALSYSANTEERDDLEMCAEATTKLLSMLRENVHSDTQRTLLENYNQQAMKAQGKPSPLWQGLGIALMMLSPFIIVLGSILMAGAPPTLPIMAGMVGLTTAGLYGGYGLFKSHSQQSISKDMSDLAHLRRFAPHKAHDCSPLLMCP